MNMTLDQILTTISTMSAFVPVPAVSVGIPMLITIARDLQKSGLFDGATTVAIELDDIGSEHQKAVEALVAQLAKHKA